MESSSVAKESSSPMSVDGLGFLKMRGFSGKIAPISFAPRRESIPWIMLPSFAL